MYRPECNRRTLFQAGAVLLGAVALDQVAGEAYEKVAMRDYPETEVMVNPESDRVILVVGGLGNDGIQIARGMRQDLHPLGSIIGVRYAQTNVHAGLLANIIIKTFEHAGLQDKKVDAYFNSAAGMIMAEPLQQLAKQKRLGTVIFDCSPHSASDVKGLEGAFVRDHADLLDRSRFFTLLSRIVSSKQQPSPNLKEKSVPLLNAAANRNAIVTADTITLGVQAAALRTEIKPGYLHGLADNFVFVHSSSSDPLVDSKHAIAGWRDACGEVREVIDRRRPAVSHAIGNDFPFVIADILHGLPVGHHKSKPLTLS